MDSNTYQKRKRPLLLQLLIIFSLFELSACGGNNNSTILLTIKGDGIVEGYVLDELVLQCNKFCSETKELNITLIAKPEPGATFIEWRGTIAESCGTDPVCMLALPPSQVNQIVAIFSEDTPPIVEGSDIYVNGILAEGFSMGVNSSEGNTSWLINRGTHMEMQYPANQSWGAVFVTFGEPVDPPRPSIDLSGYKALSFDIRGQVGGENVEIGIKDRSDPDNGTETKVKLCSLSTNWQKITIPLNRFTTATLFQIYIPIELVFSGNKAQTVSIRNIRYIKDQLAESGTC